MPAKILVVDDDIVLGELLSEILEETGAQVKHVTNGSSALTLMQEESYDLLLLDLLLPGMNGMDVLGHMQEIARKTVTIVMSGHGTIAKAVQATKLGAYDFIEKPLEKERVLLTVRNALEKSNLVREKLNLLESVKNRYRMIGVSAEIQSVFAVIDKVAKSNATVLIMGESGTGKELVAYAIHLNSNRASEKFVQVNCAAIPEELIESELFGHLVGAFTGAVGDRDGKFQQADGGTLFLDEVGDLSLRAQAKVLRAIEHGEVARVGSRKYERVDIRLIAATNQDLQKMVKQKAFREDLFHRLNVIPISIPPLRERPEDILPLIDHFMNEFCRNNNCQPKQLLPDAKGVLLGYSWPGNVRQLKNFVDKLMLLSESTEVNSHLASYLLNLEPKYAKITDDGSLQKAKKSFERSYILNVLETNEWNITKTAKQLGINRSHFYRKLEKLGISLPGSISENQ